MPETSVTVMVYRYEPSTAPCRGREIEAQACEVPPTLEGEARPTASGALVPAFSAMARLARASLSPIEPERVKLVFVAKVAA